MTRSTPSDDIDTPHKNRLTWRGRLLLEIGVTFLSIGALWAILDWMLQNLL